MVRKRRTRQHVIADLSLNHVERFALLAGFTVDRFVHDYGLDLLLVTYDADGYVEPGQVLLQVKATDSPRRLTDGSGIAHRVERIDLDRWLEERMPVILVVYDASNDVAFWLYVQVDVPPQLTPSARWTSATVTIRLPLTNRLDTEAFRQIARFRDREQAHSRTEARRDG